jgi:hypothetical protein
MNLKLSLIKLPRRSSSCLRCQELLCGEKECYSVLIQDDEIAHAEAIQRKDYCEPCWLNLRHIENTLVRNVYWKSTIAPKKNFLTPTKNRDLFALQLLKNGAENQSPTIAGEVLKSEELFCLALYLIRKRQLIVRKEIQDGEDTFMLLEICESGELLAVRKINLDNLDLPTLQRTISERLSMAHV